MLTLDPDQKIEPWRNRFQRQKLKEGDIRGPGRDIDNTSEGQYTPSWIWVVSYSGHPSSPSTQAGDEELADSMRVHWAKSQARADRYDEEVTLTIEEMGRTLRYFEWKQSWWLSISSEREKSVSPPPVDVQRGLHSYAHRQAKVYQDLTLSFASMWRKTLLASGRCPTWLSHYPADTHPPPSTSLSCNKDAKQTDHPDDGDGSNDDDDNCGDGTDTDIDNGEYVVDGMEAFDVENEFMT